MGGYSLQQGQLLSMPLKKITALLQQLMLKLSLGGEVGLPQDETVTGCADPHSCGVSTGVAPRSLQKTPFAANLPILGSYILSTPSPSMSPSLGVGVLAITGRVGHAITDSTALTGCRCLR